MYKAEIMNKDFSRTESNLKTVLKDKGYDISELAKKMNVSEVTVAKNILGVETITEGTAARLSDALGVEHAAMFGQPYARFIPFIPEIPGGSLLYVMTPTGKKVVRVTARENRDITIDSGSVKHLILYCIGLDEKQEVFQVMCPRGRVKDEKLVHPIRTHFRIGDTAYYVVYDPENIGVVKECMIEGYKVKSLGTESGRTTQLLSSEDGWLSAYQYCSSKEIAEQLCENIKSVFAKNKLKNPTVSDEHLVNALAAKLSSKQPNGKYTAPIECYNVGTTCNVSIDGNSKVLTVTGYCCEVSMSNAGNFVTYECKDENNNTYQLKSTYFELIQGQAAIHRALCELETMK